MAAPAPSLHEGAPLDRRVFNSWGEFDAYVETYARCSFQIFRRRTTTTVKLRNRRVVERASARGKADNARLIPEKYGNYALTLVCTHSGAFVSRGTGRRSRQDVRASQCHVQINACLKLADPATNRYQVNVTRALLTHNHRVDQETFVQYSNTRLNLTDEMLSCVELMRKTGVKPKDIRTYIMEHSSCAPTLKDVQNILHRLRNQEEAVAAAAAAADAELQAPQAGVDSNGNGNASESAALTSDEQVLRDYRLASTASADDESPAPVDPTTQFKVARAVGKTVATLLAEMPAAGFAGAFRVLEVATNIVRERREEKRVSEARRATSGEGEIEATTDVSGASVVVDPWG